MKRFIWLALPVLALLLPSPAHAQESPEMQLEFVRNLRAKGFSDLAKEYLDQLQKNPDPALQAILPLEAARTLVALARDKEPGQRGGFFAQARVELAKFIKSNAGKPEAGAAQVELARLTAYEAQAILSKALREEDPKSQQEQAKRAEPKFLEAGAELEAAIKLLTDLAANFKDPDPVREKTVKGQLEKERLQARLDRAINYVDQARSYIDRGETAVLEARGKVLTQARKDFEAIANDEGGSVGMLAAAWLIKVYQDTQAPAEANKLYTKVMSSTGQGSLPAKRWASLFFMQGVMENPTVKADTQGKLKIIEKDARAWLAAFPSFQKTPEGYAVQFELGQSLLQQANLLTQKEKKDKTASAAADKLLVQAQKYLDNVAQGDNDLVEKANQYSLAIAFKRVGEDKKIEQIVDFNECFLKAQYEMFKMREAIAKMEDPKTKDPKAEDKQRKAHLANAIRALRKATTLATPSTPAQKVDDARYLLATSYLVSGDLERAAVAGEALGRQRPPTRRAPYGAGYAMEAYGNLLNRDDSEAIRQRLKNLAEYILDPEQQKLWASEPVTGVAGHQVAMMYHKEKKFKEAIAQLERLPVDFPGHLYAQGQIVFMAMEAKEKEDSKAEKDAYVALARKALARMPNLPGSADQSTATMYFHAKIEEAKFLYADAAQDLGKKQLDAAAAKYIDMGKYTDALKAQFDKSAVKLTIATKDKIDFFLDMMKKYSRLGLADVDYRRGSYDKVLTDTAKVVENVKNLGKAEGPIKMKDYQVTGDFLGLVLRAFVQKGKIPEAKEVLRHLERLSSDEKDDLAQTENVLRSLVEDLQMQVRDLKKVNDTAKLKDVVTNFSAFVDELANKADGKKGLALADITFLANCYSSLDQHGKAAALYAKIPEPAALKKEAKAKLEEKEEKEVATYWFVKIQQAKALRLNGKEKGNKDELTEANKILVNLLNHPHGRMQLLADKEKVHILEDAGLYGSAIKGWGGFMSSPAIKGALGNPNLAADTRAKIKELYFDAYYHNNWCIFKLSQTEKIKGTPTEKKYLGIVAANINKLEKAASRDGWELIGPRFEELLRTEQKLRDEYEELKKTMK